MKTKQIFIVLALTIAGIGFPGCYTIPKVSGTAVGIFSAPPDQGVVVVNTMPGTRITVVVNAAYGREIFGRNLTEGTQCFVPAAMYPQVQTLVITVTAADVQGCYIGTRSRPFTFADSYGRNYLNQSWDVRRQDFHQ